ncbi:MAG: ATP-binding protein [Bacteroidales bacterium]|nr:ATP-binding protein [Bacteroidales bacterium]MDD4670343.1 ATP-binding protein [Bacteroidales bacterium]
MKQLLKDIIADQKLFLKNRKTIVRYFPKSFLQGEEIIVISGVRRCGKSVLLQQIRDNFSKNDYFFNFDDDRLSSFNVDNFQQLYEIFVELYGEQDTFFFDEIQNIDGWEHFVKRLYNSGKKVFVTGSNAKMLSRELGTLLTGCHLTYELFPFSFHEYARYNKQEAILANVAGTISKGKTLALFSNYLKDGGFPMYLKSKETIILKTLYDNILYKDVLVRNQITNEKEVKELVFYLVSNIGKPCSYTSLTKVIGVKNPTTVKSYLDFIENTYLLFVLNCYDESVKTQLRNPKKVYFIDNAMVRHLGFHFSNEAGRLLENLVFLELRKRGGDIFYYSDNTGECDFVTRNGAKIDKAIQVCYAMESPDTKEREIKGLLNAMEHFDLQEGLIITNDQDEEIHKSSRLIKVKAAWKWLLNK